MPAIAVQDLHKSYGAHVALRGIDFEVGHGEVVGFLGPNGTGKTTTMRILTGFMSPSAGTTTIEGYDVVASPIQARKKIGYLPENAPIYPDMSVHGYLDYIGQIRELGPAERARAIERVAVQCGVAGRMGQKVGALSKGYRQRSAWRRRCFTIRASSSWTSPPPASTRTRSSRFATSFARSTPQDGAPLHAHPQRGAGHLRPRPHHQPGTDCRRWAHRRGDGKRAGWSAHPGDLRARGREPRPTQPHRRTLTDGRHQRDQAPRRDLEQIAYEILADRDLRADLFSFANAQGLVMVELTRAQSNLEEVFRRLTRG